MAKRKSFIELQSKPENREVRKLIEKPKPVEYAPINSLNPSAKTEDDSPEYDSQTGNPETRTQSLKNTQSVESATDELKVRQKINDSEIETAEQIGVAETDPPEKPDNGAEDSISSKRNEQTGQERLRIFQTSSPHTRAVTQYHKAAIVVRSGGGRQTIELAWRDQMNEKTRDIWDYLVKRFNEAAETNADEILIRKRDVLENSGVKSDRTFIGAIYTLEDMELIRVRRLSGNKEGNVYILTEEGKAEIESYHKADS